jgi:DMSO/TMAO reductase YedYZ heme-binding membrane subunit
VFVATLARSSDRAKRVLGASWKRLHRLVWFTVPLSLSPRPASEWGGFAE